MGTRRRDAERRQVSLAVEALEDRFLLSGAASLSTPPTTNGHSALFADARYHTALGQTAGWQTPAAVSKTSLSAQAATLTMNAPVKPMMGYRQDDDDSDDDPPGATDGDASRNVPLVFPLSAYAYGDAMSSLACPLPTRSSEQSPLSPANLTSFLPLLSASGLGTMKPTPVLPATAIAENASANPDPSLSKEEIRPLPAVPQAPPTPPQIAEPVEPPPSSVGGPLAELLPIDVEAIQQGVDAFFQQIGHLSEQWREGHVLEELAPWLLAASLTGYGWIRLRDRRDRHAADLLGTGRPVAAPSLFLPRGEG